MADKRLFTNNAVSLLMAPLTPTSTTLTVMAGHGAMFPSPAAPNEFFVLTLENQTASLREIIHCTSRSGDTFTIERGKEGTTALTWGASSNNDTLVDHRITADTLYYLKDDPADYAYSNPAFPLLTTYKAALDYVLDPSFYTSLQDAITEINNRLIALEDHGDNYSNINFPSLTTQTIALDYLLQGGPVSGGNVVDADTTIQVVGSETTITLQTQYAPNTTAVYVGGVRQKRGVDFLESTPNELRLQFVLTPAMIADGQNVVVDYVVA